MAFFHNLAHISRKKIIGSCENVITDVSLDNDSPLNLGSDLGWSCILATLGVPALFLRYSCYTGKFAICKLFCYWHLLLPVYS